MTAVAVLGAGHGGVSAAADLSRRGHGVRLWARSEQSLSGIKNDPSAAVSPGTIDLAGIRGEGSVDVDVVSADLAAVVPGAEVVLVPLPAFAHADVAAAAAPYLDDGQVLCFMPGNFTSPAVADRLAFAGCSPSVVELATIPYGARRVGPRGVVIAVEPVLLPVGVLQGDPAAALAVLRGLYPPVSPVVDVLDAALLNPNLVIHPALLVTNAGAIEHFGDFDIHGQGTGEATMRVIEAVDAERIAVRRAAGYSAPHRPATGFYRDEKMVEDEDFGLWSGTHQASVNSSLFFEGHGLDHRYLMEDAAFGLTLVSTLGNLLDVATPVSDSILVLGSTLLDRDLRESGRTTTQLTEGLRRVRPDLLG